MLIYELFKDTDKLSLNLVTKTDLWWYVIFHVQGAPFIVNK